MIEPTLLNMDCMEYFKTIPDKHFDLVIADPPYGLGDRTMNGGCKKNSQVKFKKDIVKGWDNNAPTNEYFKELSRISIHQIIWGGNYFGLPAHRCFIVWDKMTYVSTMSQVEQAWTSFDSPARLIKINSNQLDREHRTQKPIKLYKWLLENYAKEGDKILDPMAGSFSSAIAAMEYGFEYVGIEKDKEYFDKAMVRINNYKAQGKLMFNE